MPVFFMHARTILSACFLSSLLIARVLTVLVKKDNNLSKFILYVVFIFFFCVCDATDGGAAWSANSEIGMLGGAPHASQQRDQGEVARQSVGQMLQWSWLTRIAQAADGIKTYARSFLRAPGRTLLYGVGLSTLASAQALDTTTCLGRAIPPAEQARFDKTYRLCAEVLCRYYDRIRPAPFMPVTRNCFVFSPYSAECAFETCPRGVQHHLVLTIFSAVARCQKNVCDRFGFWDAGRRCKVWRYDIDRTKAVKRLNACAKRACDRVSTKTCEAHKDRNGFLNWIAPKCNDAICPHRFVADEQVAAVEREFKDCEKSYCLPVRKQISGPPHAFIPPAIGK